MCCPLQKILAGPVTAILRTRELLQTHYQSEGGEGGHTEVCVCVHTHLYTPLHGLSSLPLLATCPNLASPPPFFYTMPLHPLSSCFPCTHSPFLIFNFSSTSITLPSFSCPSSLTPLSLSPLSPPLLVLTARCIGRGRGEAVLYPHSLST